MRPQPGRCVATVSLREPEDPHQPRPDAIVSFSGDEHLLPHVPAAYFDKILSNLRNDKPAGEDLLDRVEAFVDGIDQTDTESFFASLAEGERLSVPGKGGVPVLAACIRKESGGEQWAAVKAKVMASVDRLGATTHFKPFLRGQNPTVAELGFWALWDWTALMLLETKEFDLLADTLNTFELQISLHQIQGIPSISEIGSAPAIAAMEDEREANEDQEGSLQGIVEEEAQIAAVIEILRPRLERLATSPQGQPLQYPEWAAAAIVKMELAEILDVLEDVPLGTVLGSSQELSLEMYRQFEVAYDRAFAARGYTELVEEVSRRVLVGSEDAAEFLRSKYGQQGPGPDRK